MKRGQIQLSFGMIFSIIIIVATIAVAIYFIQSFISTSKCAQINLFAEDLRTKIDSVWKAPQAQQIFNINLPSSIEFVCIGNLSQVSQRYSSQFEQIKLYRGTQWNLFILPTRNACDGKAAKFSINHIIDIPLFCITIVNGKGNLTLSKTTSDTKVLVSA